MKKILKLTINNSIKPQIFWKDKPFLLIRQKLWNKKKLINALKKLMMLKLEKLNLYLNKKII